MRPFPSGPVRGRRHRQGQRRVAPLDAELGRLARPLADRVREIVPRGGGLALHGDHDVAGLETGGGRRSARDDLPDLRRVGGGLPGAQVPVVLLVAKDVTARHPLGDDFDFPLAVRAGDDEHELLAATVLHQPLHLVPVLDGLAVHGHDLVSGLEAGLRGHAPLGHAPHHRGHHGPAPDHEGEAGEDDGEHEVHAGAGEDDEEAHPDRLEVEGARGIRTPGAPALEWVLVVSHHLDVAAHGDERDAVLRLLALDSPQNGAKADGEALDAHPGESGDDEVAPFMDENEDAEDRHEGDNGRHRPILPAAAGTLPGTRSSTKRRVSASTATQVSMLSSARAGMPSSVGGDQLRDLGVADAPFEKSADRHFVGRVQNGGSAARRGQSPGGRGPGTGSDRHRAPRR